MNTRLFYELALRCTQFAVSAFLVVQYGGINDADCMELSGMNILTIQEVIYSASQFTQGIIVRISCLYSNYR